MKKMTWIIVAMLTLTLGSCASKKVQKSPIKTFVMPCSQLVSSDGVLRAWAVGKSDNENTARKKAQTEAAAELAAILGRTVEATTEALQEVRIAIDDSFLASLATAYVPML